MKKEQEEILELLNRDYAKLAAIRSCTDTKDMTGYQKRNEKKPSSAKLHDLIKDIKAKPIKHSSLDRIIIVENDTDIIEDDHDNNEQEVIEDTVHNANPHPIRTDGIGDEYMRHTDIYRQFMSAEYQHITTKANADYDYNKPDKDSQETFAWGDEVISYRERKDIVKKMMINSLMQGEHNHIDPRQKEKYKFWTYASKFNFLMSTLMYDKAISLN